VARAVHKGHVPDQSVCSSTSFTLARWVHLLLALVTPVAGWARAFGIITLINLCVCVSKLDCNVAFQLVLEPDCLDARDGLYYGGLSMSHMAYRSNVDGCLTGDDEVGQRRKLCYLEVFRFGLGGQLWSYHFWSWCGLLERGFRGCFLNLRFRGGRIVNLFLGI
jgi:hypothetical protein